ncbi:dihydroorotase [Rhodopirellula sp. MGV]|uniref:dihydroorotase n=1 Tax=Rhodopirellula sp. MGV TaxID=2023130 RepID=UPI000B96F804|nr:dihydroorotase [Rhodopirellula sp. MGV]OYP37021.1 dihydroorotase [Rhodopirellula sp. MGV]PNY36216.1 dihydroorotase [Rhodopirellula baltica]
MSRTLFRNASIVLPNSVVQGSLVVEDGKIVDVNAGDHASADSVVECDGLHLMPGVIDDQVHFRDPGLTHKEDLATASRACAAGGVTSFLEMPNTKPPAVTAEGVRAKERIASKKSLVNYGFYIGATPDNVDELNTVKDVPGIKIFIGSSTGNLLVDEQEALERIFAETTLPICAHCEDETTVRANAERLAGTTNIADHSNIRDENAAINATRRATELSRRYKHRFHVLHVSTAAEVPLVADGAPYITSEVCLHHLFFNVDDYARLGSRIQMNPSIKTAADNKGLYQALLDGSIQVIATDHAPHTLEEKSQPYPQSPSGLPAVENSLALMLNEVSAGRCEITQVASWMCDAPARVWGMVGKGRIEPGYDADLVLVNLAESRTIRDAEQHTKAKWSPWDQVTLQGWPVATYIGGHPVFQASKGFDESFRGQKLRFDHSRGGYWATPEGIGS